jgi:protein-S-isoprenylcysteine O-methyltransferase Ste14
LKSYPLQSLLLTLEEAAMIQRLSARPWLPLPPRLVLVLLLSMLALRLALARGSALVVWQVACGASLALGGLALTLSAARHFERVKTNIVTFGTPTLLVQDGWFRISRNPMYLGFASFLGGVALALGGAWLFVPAASFVLAAELVYIPFEERALAQAFGEEYRRYAARVRRWLGRRSAGQGG